MGEVEVEVTQGSSSVPVSCQSLSVDQSRFTFIAMSPKDHLINVKFNKQQIPGCYFAVTFYLIHDYIVLKE